MRTPASSPLRAVMMVVPLVAVGILASMGGYHFRTVVASQTSEGQEGELPDEAVLLDAEVGESAHCSTEELFADFTGDTLPEITEAPQHVERAGSHAGAVAIQDIGSPRHGDRSHPGKTRRFPDAALAGWKVADAGLGNRQNFGNDSETVEASVMESTDFVSEAAVANEESSPLSGIQTARETRPRRGTRNREGGEAKAALVSEKKRSERGGSTKKVFGPQRRGRNPHTLREAALRLGDLGIRKYRLETNPENGSYRFRCAVTEANNPSIRRQFEAIADEPLLAVRKVLRQVEEWRAQE